jgi:hypothetical protein
VDVFRHDDEADQLERVIDPGSVEQDYKAISGFGCAEEGTAPKATEGNEVRIVLTVG